MFLARTSDDALIAEPGANQQAGNWRGGALAGGAGGAKAITRHGAPLRSCGQLPVWEAPGCFTSRLWPRAHGTPEAPECAGRAGGALSLAFGAGSASSIVQTGEMVPREEAKFGSFNRTFFSR